MGEGMVRQAAQLPAIDQLVGPSPRPSCLRQEVGDIRRKQVPRVVIPVAIVQLYVIGVIRNGGTILADFIQSVGPGVAKLRAQPVPRPDAKGALQRIIVRRAYAVKLEDVAEVREVRTARVNVRYDIQLASLASNVTNLKYGGIAKALLNLQVEDIDGGRTEILVDRIRTQALGIPGGSAIGIDAFLNAREDGCATGLCLPWSGTPVILSLSQSIRTVCRNRRRTKSVALDALRCGNGWAEIQERVHINLIIEDAYSAAHDEVAFRCRLIGETDPRGKIVSIRRKNGIGATPLDHEARTRDKHGDVLLAAMERPEVFIAHAEIQVQSLGRLPGILKVEIVGVHYYPTLRISYRDRRGGHVASKEVGQSIPILAG